MIEVTEKCDGCDACRPPYITAKLCPFCAYGLKRNLTPLGSAHMQLIDAYKEIDQLKKILALGYGLAVWNDLHDPEFADARAKFIAEASAVLDKK